MKKLFVIGLMAAGMFCGSTNANAQLGGLLKKAAKGVVDKAKKSVSSAAENAVNSATGSASDALNSATGSASDALNSATGGAASAVTGGSTGSSTESAGAAAAASQMQLFQQINQSINENTPEKQADAFAMKARAIPRRTSTMSVRPVGKLNSDKKLVNSLLEQCKECRKRYEEHGQKVLKVVITNPNTWSYNRNDYGAIITRYVDFDLYYEIAGVVVRINDCRCSQSNNGNGYDGWNTPFFQKADAYFSQITDYKE